jgi:hypothetical protein
VKTIEKYNHEVASHCETGTVRNLLAWAGLKVSEPMVFGIGSGPAFYYLFFAKGPSGFPLIGTRNPPGSVLNNVKKLLNIGVVSRKYRSTRDAITKANELVDSGIPVGVLVDMFYMKYLPSFLQVHAPFHFISLIGRNGDSYAVSDPYHEEIGELPLENLEAAMATHAPMAKDNYIMYIERVPERVDWREAAQRAIRKTCDDNLLPPVVKNVFSFVGVQGIRTYARKIRQWPKKYRGVFLREGILFNAVGFEDQGTGGGAFRLVYGAFLQEISKKFGSSAMNALASEVIHHGKAWRDISRLLIKVGKTIPMDDGEYSDWYRDNGKTLDDQLGEISRLFIERADFEEVFFRKLKKAVSEI